MPRRAKRPPTLCRNGPLSKPDASISLPTGSTPLGMFDVLAARAARGEIDFSGVTVFCLDEYVGVTVERSE